MGSNLREVLQLDERSEEASPEDEVESVAVALVPDHQAGLCPVFQSPDFGTLTASHQGLYIAYLISYFIIRYVLSIIAVGVKMTTSRKR